jgi:hypothetical protein
MMCMVADWMKWPFFLPLSGLSSFGSLGPDIRGVGKVYGKWERAQLRAGCAGMVLLCIWIVREVLKPL